MGSVVRVKELASSLGSLGVEVYIFTPYERSFDLSPRVHVVSMNILTSSVGLSKALYRLTKFLYYGKAFPSLYAKTASRQNCILIGLTKIMSKTLLRKNIDLIQVEQDVALPIGLGLKNKTNLPLIVDLHNVSSEELVTAGVFKKESLEFSVLQNWTRNCLADADRVAVVSDCMRDYVIANYGLKPIDVCVVPPGGRSRVDKSVVMKRTRPFKIVYGGLVACRERVDLFVKSMPFVMRHNEGVQFYITNKGEAIREIRKLATQLGVEPTFFWFNDYGAANRFLSQCHIGVLPSANDLARRMGTPAKLFNYMSLGLPIVANDIGGWAEIISKEKVGLVCSDDPNEFGQALMKIADDPRAMREYALNGMALVEKKYNWDISAQTLLTTYEDLVGKS